MIFHLPNARLQVGILLILGDDILLKDQECQVFVYICCPSLAMVTSLYLKKETLKLTKTNKVYFPFFFYFIQWFNINLCNNSQLMPLKSGYMLRNTVTCPIQFSSWTKMSNVFVHSNVSGVHVICLWILESQSTIIILTNVSDAKGWLKIQNIVILNNLYMNQLIYTNLWFIYDSYDHFNMVSKRLRSKTLSLNVPKPETGVLNTLSRTLFISLKRNATSNDSSTVNWDLQWGALNSYLSLGYVLYLCWRTRYWFIRRSSLNVHPRSVRLSHTNV